MFPGELKVSQELFFAVVVVVVLQEVVVVVVLAVQWFKGTRAAR